MLLHFFFILYNKSVMNLTYQKKKKKSVLNFISPFSLQVQFLAKIEIGRGDSLTLNVLQLASGTFESLQTNIHLFICSACCWSYFLSSQTYILLPHIAKGLVAELAPPHVQSAWGFRGERVGVTGLAACCNYLSKKKKYCFLI